MNIFTRFALVVASLASLAITSPAHAFNVSAVGSFNLSYPSVTPTPTGLDGGTGFGGGALLGWSAFPGFGWEVGALYTPTKFEQSATPLPGTISVSANNLIIPVALRFTALPLVSVGAGMYYSMPMGKVKSDIAGAITETDGKSDFGALVSASLRMPLVPTFGLIIDARYLLGLKSNEESGTTTKGRTVQILAGLNFAL